MNIEFVGENAIVDDGASVFTFEVSDNPRSFDTYRVERAGLDWGDIHYHIGDWRIFPYGNDNQLPKQIRDIVAENYIAPGLLKKKTQWLWGRGPKLYIETMEDGQLVRKWVDDPQVMNWLKSWDFEKYLTAAAVDFNHIEGTFTKFYQGKGGRIGKPSIAKLEHCSPTRARLAARLTTTDIAATHAVVTDWSFEEINSVLKPKVYKLFDFKKPFEAKTSMYYSNMYSFCSDYYTVPDLYGAFEWLRRSTAVPLILKALSKNSLNVKYHVISPQKFWNDKREDIVANCNLKGVKYQEKMFLSFKKDFLKQVAKVLSGEENTGKFWHSTKSFEVDGTNLIEHGWEIKVIEQNVKDFIEAQISVSKRADHAVASTTGMGSILGNISEGGSSNSGSDRIYAMKDYLETGIDIPEMIVCKPINLSIAANWPEKEVKVGFFHTEAKAEQEVTPKDRVKNIKR